jgi:hypothetical protein
MGSEVTKYGELLLLYNALEQERDILQRAVEIAKGQDKRLRGVLKELVEAVEEVVMAVQNNNSMIYLDTLKNLLSKAREARGEVGDG